MFDELLEIPNVSSLTGCRIYALESDNGEPGYLIRLGRPDGSSVDLLASVVELENLRQNIDRAVLGGMFGSVE